MASKSQDLVAELLVYGYVHLYYAFGNNSSRQSFPEVLFDLLIEYYFDDSYFSDIGDQCKLNAIKTIVSYRGDALPTKDGESLKQPNTCYHSVIMPSISETETEYVFKLKILQIEDILCIGIDSTDCLHINDDFTAKTDSYHYSFYSKDGTSWDNRNAVPDKRTYQNSGRGYTFGMNWGKNDMITVRYNPFKSTVQFQGSPGGSTYGDGRISVHKQMGLQYRLCIFMGDYGHQEVELVEFQRTGDDDENTDNDEDQSDEADADEIDSSTSSEQEQELDDEREPLQANANEVNTATGDIQSEYLNESDDSARYEREHENGCNCHPCTIL